MTDDASQESDREPVTPPIRHGEQGETGTPAAAAAWYLERLPRALRVMKDVLEGDKTAAQLKLAEGIVERCAEKADGRRSNTGEQGFESLLAELPTRAELRAALEGKT